MPREQNPVIQWQKPPDVLLLGNGILRLNGGGDWNALLQDIQNPPPEEKDLTGVPYAMQPECLCGTDVEEVQRRTAQAIVTAAPHPILQRLLQLPFDAILTTNYTYEIEEALTGKNWSDDRERRKAFRALDDNTHVRHNTCVCNMVHCVDGRTVPVFHIHGEKGRKHSLVLSYYSYANAVSRLITLNKQRGNTYQEHQQEGTPLPVLSWLDYFILGNVYAVGFGFDTSEFDVWWAIERKARENAAHGSLQGFMIESPGKHLPQEVLFASMQAKMKRISNADGYPAAYEHILNNIEREVNGNV